MFFDMNDARFLEVCHRNMGKMYKDAMKTGGAAGKNMGSLSR